VVETKTDLIPPSFIVSRYFAAEQTKVDDLNAKAEEAIQAVEEYVGEHAGEDADDQGGKDCAARGHGERCLIAEQRVRVILRHRGARMRHPTRLAAFPPVHAAKTP